MAANRLLTLVWNQAGLMPLDRVYREIRTMLDAREVGAPRHFRRVIMRQREKMTKVLADCHAMIDRKFEEITRNYDPETGTLDGVQEEAEAMIARARSPRKWLMPLYGALRGCRLPQRAADVDGG